MTSRAARRLAAALALVAAGCSAGPYWSEADRQAAERRDAAERAARSTAPAPEPASPEPPPPAAAPPPEVVAEAPAEPPVAIEAPQSEPLPAPPSTGTIDESDLVESDLESETSPEAGTEAASPTGDRAALEAEYDAALDRLQRGELVEAEADFRAFLSRHGASDLADNAQYWIGESLARRGEAGRALAEFRFVVERYPDGNKVPDALLKIGLGLEAEGSAELAREVYGELLRRFPATAAAESARARLATLGAGSGDPS